jgi:replicative DNA helicase
VIDLTKPADGAEWWLCGAMMLDNSIIGSVSEIVSAEDFAERECREVFVSIMRTWGSGKQVDPTTVVMELPPDVDREAVYDAYSSVGSAASWRGYADRVAGAAIRRKLQAEGRAVAKMAESDDREVGQVLGDAQARVLSVSEKSAGESLSDVIMRVQRESEEASRHPSGVVGVSYGIETVDNVTGGMFKHDFIVVAARPSVGKSALVKSCIVMENLLKTDRGMAVFSAEDSREAFILRMASQLSGVDGNRLRRGDMNRDEWVRYGDACSKIDEVTKGRMLLDDKARPTPGYIMNKCRQWVAAGNPLDFVVIDYIQKMGEIGGRTDYEIMSRLAYACDDLKKDLNVPVVLVAQLSRGAEGRDEIKTPVVTDLKSTGALEEAATVVLLLHRASRAAQDATLWVAKNKNGPVGDCALKYNPLTTTFKE